MEYVNTLSVLPISRLKMSNRKENSVFVSSVKYSWLVASNAATDEAQILQLSVSSLLFDGIVMLMRGVATYVGQDLFVQLSITHEETAILGR